MTHIYILIIHWITIVITVLTAGMLHENKKSDSVGFFMIVNIIFLSHPYYSLLYSSTWQVQFFYGIRLQE